MNLYPSLKIVALLVLLSFFSCKKTNSQKSPTPLSIAQKQLAKEQTALVFINSYVVFSNERNAEVGLVEWVSQQSNVTEQFKSTLQQIITEAEAQDPELGLGFDPIFDAQDYPEKGFELEAPDQKADNIIVKGKDWSSFKLKLKMLFENGQWFVDGVGIVNIPESERIKR